MRFPGFERKRDAPPDSPSAAWWPATDEGFDLRFIVITADEEFYLKLGQIAGSCDWKIARVASIDEAEALIRNKPAPLVVYEGDSGDGNWRSGLRRLNELPTHPCVLLASSVSDDNLLREVIRNHGYDILPKSAPKENLIRCLNFAWFWALAWGRGRP